MLSDCLWLGVPVGVCVGFGLIFDLLLVGLCFVFGIVWFCCCVCVFVSVVAVCLLVVFGILS